MGWLLPRGTGRPAGVLAARCLRGESWLEALFYVLFILLRETEEFSVQESRVLALFPRCMKAAEQTRENQRRLRPIGFPHRQPHCQLLHKLSSGLHRGLFPRKPSSHPSKVPAVVLSLRSHLLAMLFCPLDAQPWYIQLVVGTVVGVSQAGLSPQCPALPILNRASSLHFISSQQFRCPQHKNDMEIS